MNRRDAEKIINEYCKPIYGFALKHCRSRQDAEDLSQEIVLKAFRALIVKDNISDIGKFIRAIAFNARSNYYRDTAKTSLGIPLDEVSDTLPDPSAEKEDFQQIERLQSEIAYLSKTQRDIVIAYYYENKKQSRIAQDLNLPLGTVKWHLFEAKKELKRGMETMRKSNELKFNPIRFSLCGTNGSPGTKGSNANFFRTILSQNIAYDVFKEAKTVNEIAEDLGVSPVYVENEAAFLEEYNFLTKHGDKHLCNILLEEPTAEFNRLQDEVYQKAADIFANELYEDLMASDIWSDSGLSGGVTAAGTEKDRNFFLWSLIPYIASHSGEEFLDTSVSFEEAATIRPDGGQNICYTMVETPEKPVHFDSMQRFYGPCWNKNGNLILWQIDSEWSAKRVDDTYTANAQRILALLNREISGDTLSKDEYAYLAEKGILQISPSAGEKPETVYRIVRIEDKKTKHALIEFGNRIYRRHESEFRALRERYSREVLDKTPEHLRTMQKFGLQYLFFCDGWFNLYCLKALVDQGKLKPPAEEDKKSLTMVVFSES